MNKELKACLILFVAMIALVFYTSIEGFIASKDEKAGAIFNWFSTGGKKYEAYREAVVDSNIVEYEEVRKTLGTPDFTLKNITKII